MAIAKLPDDNRQTSKVEEPVILPPEYKAAVVDSRYEPKKVLTTYAEGRPWVVEYYRQLLGKSEEPIAQQPGDLAPQQQYQRIRDMRLKVQTPLMRNPLQDKGEMDITGEAYLLPCGFTPNIGDMFIADMGDGNAAVFTIYEAPEQMSIFRDTMFRIQYRVTDYLNATLQKDFARKVVVDTIYDLDRARYGRNPIITVDEHYRKESLQEARDSLIYHYMDNFYWGPEETIAIPNQRFTAYDPYLVRFVAATVGYKDKLGTKPISQLNIKDFRNNGKTEVPTLWDAIMRSDPRVLRNAVLGFGLAGRRTFAQAGLFHSISDSKFENVVRPRVPGVIFIYDDLLTGDAQTDSGLGGSSTGSYTGELPKGYVPPTKAGYRVRYFERVTHRGLSKIKIVYEAITDAAPHQPIVGMDDVLTPVVFAPLSTDPGDDGDNGEDDGSGTDTSLHDELYKPLYELIDGGDTRPLFPKLSIRHHYVFSKAFYEARLADMSILEAMTYNMIHDLPLELVKVKILLSRYYDLQGVEQCYFGPILMALAWTGSNQVYNITP